MRTPIARLAAASFAALVFLPVGPFGLAAQAQEPASEVDPDSLDRRRLITLKDGRVLRGRSQLEEGVWRFRANKQWNEVEGVEAVKLEREVLAEARRMESDVKRDEHSKRAVLAAWMVRQGLYPEAIAHLDRVLRSDPEHVGALALIRETYIPLELVKVAPGDVAGEIRALVRKGAGGTPAAREIATARLIDQQGIVDLRQLAKAELGAMQHKRRAFAAHLMRRVFPGEMLLELEDRVVLDGSRTVREAAAVALRQSGDAAVLGPPINSLWSKNANVRANAAEALGNIGFAAAVQPLMARLAALQGGSGAPTGTRASMYIGNQTAYVMDFDVEIAQAASIADPIIGVVDSAVVFDVRTTVQMTRTLEMREVVTSLSKLTNQRHQTPEAWEKWWEENQGEWQSLDHARAMQAPETKAE